MTRIAHLTDLHLLEPRHADRRGASMLRLSYLSFGRRADAPGRRLRALQALTHARATGAAHVVLTGDLTEDGLHDQFTVLAEVLSESGWAPGSVTLVPGNHDLYDDPHAWERALAGPLRAYEPTSRPGARVPVGGAWLMPLCTRLRQSYLRSASALGPEQIAAARHAARDARAAGRPVILALHHPPFPHPLLPMQWIDGPLDHRELSGLLRDHDHVHAFHGHTHVRRDAPVRSGGPARVFSAEAVVQSPMPLRTYDVRHGRVWPSADVFPGGVVRLATA